MKKNLIRVALFGALAMAISTSFVGCKDYDDDINRIDKELTDVKSALAELKSKVDAGVYVTSIVKEGTGLKITWSDGKTSIIDTIKGDTGDTGATGPAGPAGAAGSVVTINEDGFWCIDGVPTEYNVKNATTFPPKVVDNYWAFYDEATKAYVKSDKFVYGSYAVKVDGKWMLHIVNQSGQYETIELPTASSLITEMNIEGLYDGANTISGPEFGYNGTIVGQNNNGNLTPDQIKWNKVKGVKQLAKGQLLSTLDKSSILVRVAPATLDATQLSFSLMNSTLGMAPFKLGAPVAFDKLLTTTRAAVSGNGLWTIPVQANDATYKDFAAFEKNFAVNGKEILFALKEKDGFATQYDVTFVKDDARPLTTKVEKINGTDAKAKSETYSDADIKAGVDANIVAPGELNTITFVIPANVYDAYLEFDEATITRWGITEISGTSFKVGKLADNITLTAFQVIVHYVDLNGAVKAEYMVIKPSKVYAAETVLPTYAHAINATITKDNFTESIAPMFTDLGANLPLWKADVASSSVEYFKVKSGDETADTQITPSNDGLTLSFLKADKSVVIGNDLKDAVSVKVFVNQEVQLEVGETYYALVKFTDAVNDGDVLNTLKVPFTISIPAISDFFKPQAGVLVDGVLNAIMTHDDKTAGDVSNATYKLYRAFNQFATTTTGLYYNLNLDKTTKIAKDKKSSELATLSDTEIVPSDANNIAITLTNILPNGDGTQAGYKQELIVNVTNAKYLGKYAYAADDNTINYTFKIKLMSPLFEGKIVAVTGSKIVIPATALAGKKITNEDLRGYTYNTQPYSVLPDQIISEVNVTQWTRPEVKSVTYSSSDENIFKTSETADSASNDGPDGSFVPGSLKVTPINLATTAEAKLKVLLTDIWGYKLNQSIDVTVKVGE